MKQQIKDKAGYILLHKPNHPHNKKGYVREHRLVVEKKINRILRPSEKVHHIDEKKDNNHISNLMLFKNDQDHIKFHTKIRQFGFTEPIKQQIKNRWRDYKDGSTE